MRRTRRLKPIARARRSGDQAFHSVREHLAEAESHGLVRPAQLEPELEYLFRHALVQDAIYESLLKQDKKRLHRAVAANLQALYPDRLNEFAARLAFHYDLAEEPHEALRYYRLAGEHATKQFANQEAESYYRAALGFASQEDDRLEVLTQLGEVLEILSRNDEAIQTYRDALNIARAHENTDRIACLYGLMARVEGNRRNNATASRIVDEGLAEVGTAEDSPGLIVLLRMAGFVRSTAGRHDEALALGRRAVLAAEACGSSEQLIAALIMLGTTLGFSDPQEARLCYERAAVLIEQEAFYSHAAVALHSNLAWFLRVQGDFPASRDSALREMEIGLRRGVLGDQIDALSQLTWANARLGNLDELERNVRDMDALTAEIRSENWEKQTRCAEGFLQRYRGQLEHAAATLQALLPHFVAMNNIGLAYFVSMYAGEALMDLAHWQEAEDALQRALHFADHAMLPVRIEGRCRLSILYSRQGRIAEAQQHFEQAAEQAGAKASRLQASFLALAEGHLRLAEGRLEESTAAFERAADLQQGMGMRWYRAQTFRDWAEALIKLGQRDRALDMLREAKSEFEEMGVSFYAARVEERVREIASQERARG